MNSSTRAKTVAFIAILTVSAGIMLWLFWRFPLTTAIVALAIVTALFVLVRLARSIEFDISDLERREPIL
jgi:O-antigen ligase